MTKGSKLVLGEYVRSKMCHIMKYVACLITTSLGKDRFPIGLHSSDWRAGYL